MCHGSKLSVGPVLPLEIIMLIMWMLSYGFIKTLHFGLPLFILANEFKKSEFAHAYVV